MSTITLDRETVFVSTIMEMADSIAFDGCHKIYVLMDREQTEKMLDYRYDNIVTDKGASPSEMLEIVENWYRRSCPFRLIDAIYTLPNGEEKCVVVRAQGE